MWRSKKFITIGALMAVVLIGSTAGAVLANDDEAEAGADTQCNALLERVCEIYEENTGVAIDADDLQDAFAQATGESRNAALQSFLDKLVEEGTITQEEADEYLEWWQQRPDIANQLSPGPFGSQHTLRHRVEFGPGCGFGGWGWQNGSESTD
jgi:hypothetical protein